MTDTCTYTHVIVHANRYDPTRTTALRNAFVKEMRRRFNELVRIVRQAVDKDDCFGLRKIQVMQMTSPGNAAFAFPRSQDKVEAFMKWLQQQIDRGILRVGELPQVGAAIEGAWTNKFIFDTYKRGVMRARYELIKAGYDVPTIEQTGGWEISMGTPFHLDRLGLLYTRVYSDLKGITAAMDSQIARILAQGIADGDNPMLLARKLVATINGTGMGDLGITDTLGRFIPAKRRAEMLARTEIIRAHHQATIQEYMNWRVEGVMIKAEWGTAGDDKVCSICKALEGQVFTLEEVMNMVPAHPNCRCFAIPFKQTLITRKGFGTE